MSGIDTRAPVANPAVATDPQSTDVTKGGGLSGGELLPPGVEPNSSKGPGVKGPVHAHGARGAGAAQQADDVTDATGPSEADAAKRQGDGLIHEKKRTGHAALSEVPPMPPSALRASPEHLQNFQSLNQDMHEAMTRGMATNQPSMQRMSEQLAKLDTSTPEGKAKADQLNGRMTQVSVNALRSSFSGSGLSQFMALALGFASKQQAINGRIQDLTMKGRETLGKQQQAQREEQSKALKKAEKKQAALSFLKPLLAVFMALLTVLTAGTLTGPALALMGAAMAAGFVIGGAVGGKKNGGGFDIGAAFEGLAAGAMAGGLANVVVGAMIKAAEAAAALGFKAGAKAGSDAITKQIAEQLRAFGIKRSAEGSKALDEAAKTGEVVAKKVAQDSANGGNRYMAKVVEKTKAFNEPAVEGQGNVLSQAAAKINKLNDKFSAKAEKSYWLPNAQATMAVSQAVMDGTGGMVEAAVNQQRAVASNHEAVAKLLAVLEKSLTQEGDRNQEIMDNLVQRRKSTFDGAENLLKNSNQAATNAIRGIAR